MEIGAKPGRAIVGLFIWVFVTLAPIFTITPIGDMSGRAIALLFGLWFLLLSGPVLAGLWLRRSGTTAGRSLRLVAVCFIGASICSSMIFNQSAAAAFLIVISGPLVLIGFVVVIVLDRACRVSHASILLAICVTTAAALLGLRVPPEVSATLQLEVAESDLRSAAESWHSHEGIKLRVLHRRIIDGGSGFAFSQERLDLNDDRADEAWFSATGDSTTCTHLRDEWFWCR